jgi:hypothetical protein
MRASVLRKAVEYVISPWTGLRRNLDDPRVPRDSNRRHAARGMVTDTA